jgi:hypothetical protein
MHDVLALLLGGGIGVAIYRLFVIGAEVIAIMREGEA